MRFHLPICILILIIPFESFSMDPKAVELNNQGVEKLLKEEPYAAYNLFLESLSGEPFNAKIHLNLGLSFEANKENAKAYQEFMTSFRYAETEEDKFTAAFNAGNAAAADKNIDLALKAYQLALSFKPDSEDVKKNIELLWKGGGGGGEGGKDQNKGEGDQQNQDQNQDPNQESPPQKEKPKPKKFQSENLSKDDVRKILEEIKNQEQKIRAKEYDKGRKEAPKNKDW